MSYIVLARKWRPMIFEDVIGQEHVTRTLINSLKNDRIAHAYIFAGPRGIGKTTTARLLAKAVNCENESLLNPCNECHPCKSITNGTNLDVIEIDGASNRGIDEIRNLRDNIRFSPASSRYKIYIIDEVHMLTKEAFNALLKTLEEPPRHAIFIFATTEIHKVPLTILSRCQRFDFKRIPLTEIQNQLKKIIKAEKIEIDNEALLLIARKAEGSMRDAQSILDQMISFSDGKIVPEQVRLSLGLIEQDVYFELTDLLYKNNNADLLNYAGKIISSGHDLIDFIHGLQEHFRNLLIVNSLKNTKLLDISDHNRKHYEDAADKFTEMDLIHYLHIIMDSESDMKFSNFPQLNLEMLLLKIANKPPSMTMENIISVLEEIKKNSGKPSNNTLPSTIETKSANEKTRSTQNQNHSNRDKTGKREWKDQVKSSSGKNMFGSLNRTLSNFNNIESEILEKDEQPEDQIDITLSEVKEHWSEVIEAVRSQKVALGSFFQEGIPHRLEAGKLIVAYDKKSSFHREHVEINRDFIENVLENIFKKRIRMIVETIDFKKEGIKLESRTPEDIFEDIKNKEPIMKNIIERFDLHDIDKSDQNS